MITLVNKYDQATMTMHGCINFLISIMKLWVFFVRALVLWNIRKFDLPIPTLNLIKYSKV